jgi:hypothetical protein
MLHGSISKPQVVASVLTSGHDGNLAKGQLAVVKDRGVKGQGLQVVSDFAGMSKKDRIQIKIGEMTTPANLRVKEVKAKATGWFPLESVLEITAHAPKLGELKVDHLEVGYDGINDSTALFIPEGKSSTFDIMLYGEVASTFFGQEEYLITKEVYRPEGVTMQEVIRKLVKELQEERVPVATGWASISDQLSQFLEIGVIDSENAALVGTSWTFSSINVPNAGESNDFAAIQAQYPTYKVVQTNRENGVTTYTILHPTSVSLSNASIVDVNSAFKGCADCLATYSLITGGVVYSISLEDDGTDQEGLVDGLPGYVADSVNKVGNDNGVGTYLVVLDDALTDAEKTSFLATNAIAGTATFTELGEVQDVCFKTATTSYTWGAGESCVAGIKQFSIVLPDTECGATRLSELQAAYPDLTIEEGLATGNATQTVTVSTDAALAIVIDGTTYNTADAGTVAQTATAFFSAHAATILSVHGLTLTNPSSAALLFAGSAANFPTITAASQTVGAIDYLVTATAGGCKRTYSTTVVTNLVCDQCDDIFLQPFQATAPEDFESISWEEKVTAFNEDALMGIFVKGKPFYIYPEQYEEDFVPYVETSLKIKSMTFGSAVNTILNYTGSIYDPELEFAPSRKLQYAEDVNNDAGALFGAERMGDKFFTNKDIHKGNLFARTNLSQERILKYHKNYVQYAVKFRDTALSQMGASRSDITHEFRMIVEYGKHTALEGVLNSLAGKLGLEAVHII